MNNILFILQIVLATFLVFSILVQEKNSGLGEALGGQSQSGFETSKRGAERLVARATVLFLVLFLANSILLNFL